MEASVPQVRENPDADLLTEVVPIPSLSAEIDPQDNVDPTIDNLDRAGSPREESGDHLAVIVRRPLGFLRRVSEKLIHGE
jgi:hypothetical protein